MKNWTIVYKTKDISRAEIVKGVLNENGIQAVIVNKSDSSLPLSYGQMEILVPRDVVLRAVKIVNDEIAFK
jgi:Zn-dependent membrane protease YugP